MQKDKFAVFDIDGTLIRWQLYHVIVNRLAKEGALGQKAQTELKGAMMTWKRRENTDAFKSYEKVLVENYERALQNISTQLFDQLVTEVIDEYKDQTYIYTRNLLHKLKADGYKLFIISGSHLELIEQIGRYYGFDDWIGTHYERSQTGFTGRVQTSTLQKNESLDILLERNDVTTKDSIGVGDTKGDIPMLRKVEKPIAFNPDEALFAEARSSGWKIVVERKNVIYELESRDGTYVLATPEI